MVELTFLVGTKKCVNTSPLLDTTQRIITLAGCLVVILLWTSLREEAIQRSLRLWKAQSTVKFFSSEKNFMTPPLPFIHVISFLNLCKRIPRILSVKRCLLPWTYDVNFNLARPLPILLLLTPLFLAKIVTGVVGLVLTLLFRPLKKRDVSFLSLLGLLGALETSPNLSYYLHTS